MYQIIYSKPNGSGPYPLTTWASGEQEARKKAAELRKVGYSVDVWERTETGSRKVLDAAGR